MPVTLKPEQQAWLERQVKDGTLPSVEDGVQQAVADMMAITEDDLAWAKADVDAARADVETSEVTPAADVIARLRNRPAN
jgi:Arc/MetJ-type ribon-helix-helix transcriptional regulator